MVKRMSASKEVRGRMGEAEDRLPDWISNAVEEAQEQVFDGEKLDEGDLREINEIDERLKRNGHGGLWGTVRYRIYTEEGDDGDVVAIDTFGVPTIPPDADVGIDEETRQRYNDALTEYGVVVSERVEEQFEEWRDE